MLILLMTSEMTHSSGVFQNKWLYGLSTSFPECETAASFASFPAWELSARVTNVGWDSALRSWNVGWDSKLSDFNGKQIRTLKMASICNMYFNTLYTLRRKRMKVPWKPRLSFWVAVSSYKAMPLTFLCFHTRSLCSRRIRHKQINFFFCPFPFPLRHNRFFVVDLRHLHRTCFCFGPLKSVCCCSFCFCWLLTCWRFLYWNWRSTPF